MMHEISTGKILPCAIKDPCNGAQTLVKKDTDAHKSKESNPPCRKRPILSLKRGVPKVAVQKENINPGIKVGANIHTMCIPDQKIQAKSANITPCTKQTTCQTPANQPQPKRHTPFLTLSTNKPKKTTPTNQPQPKRRTPLLTLTTNKQKKCTSKSDIMYVCDFCDKIYGSKSNLLKHIKMKHPEKYGYGGNILCQEEKCNYSCRVLHQLRIHLQAKHGQKMETKQKHFETMEGK